MMTSSGSTPSFSWRRLRSRKRRSQVCHQSSALPSGSPVAVRQDSSSSPSLRRCSITSGTPPARNTRIVTCPTGPFGSTSTRRGVLAFTSIQSSAAGRGSPAAWAMAGTCSSRLVDPPKAAWTTIALRRAAGVSTFRTVVPVAWSRASARADRTAMSSQIA